MASCSSDSYEQPSRRSPLAHQIDPTPRDIDDLPLLLMQIFENPELSPAEKHMYTESIMPIIYLSETVGKNELAFWEYLFCDRVMPSFFESKWEWQKVDNQDSYYCAIFDPKPKTKGTLRIFRCFRLNGQSYRNECFAEEGDNKYLFYLLLKNAKCYGVQFVTRSDDGFNLDINE